MTGRLFVTLVAIVCMAAGCGGSGGGAPKAPVIGAAKVYHLSGFSPSGVVRTGQPVTISFTVRQPSGAPLVHYRTGPGPHVGVHLIIVRDDLATIIHRHPPIGKNGLVQQRVVFTKPGPYHVLVDLYPATSGPGYVNFQLFTSVHVAGAYHPITLPPFRPEVTVDGWRFTIKHLPVLHLAQASLLTVTVRNAAGQPAMFLPWYGAMGHAIFFHQHDLAYFHTHICAPNQTACATVGGATAISGSSTVPGVMHVGVLPPEAGVWRLFLQCQVHHGQIITAPFTLTVR
ncbi:MAG TPA: hypothetical protein VGL44_17425 [Gaiellales bacterium]|jgi:hypothetical protein